MADQILNNLALQSVAEEKQIEAEQSFVVSLHQFAQSLQHKTQRELIDIRLKVLIEYQHHFEDKHISRLCLYMIEVIEKQMGKVKE